MTTTNFLSSHLFVCIILDLSKPLESPPSISCFMWVSLPEFETQELSFLSAILESFLHLYNRVDEKAEWALATAHLS